MARNSDKFDQETYAAYLLRKFTEGMQQGLEKAHQRNSQNQDRELRRQQLQLEEERMYEMARHREASRKLQEGKFTHEKERFEWTKKQQEAENNLGLKKLQADEISARIENIKAQTADTKKHGGKSYWKSVAMQRREDKPTRVQTEYKKSADELSEEIRGYQSEIAKHKKNMAQYKKAGASEQDLDFFRSKIEVAQNEIFKKQGALEIMKQGAGKLGGTVIPTEEGQVPRSAPVQQQGQGLTPEQQEQQRQQQELQQRDSSLIKLDDQIQKAMKQERFYRGKKGHAQKKAALEKMKKKYESDYAIGANKARHPDYVMGRRSKEADRAAGNQTVKKIVGSANYDEALNILKSISPDEVAKYPPDVQDAIFRIMKNKEEGKPLGQRRPPEGEGSGMVGMR